MQPQDNLSPEEKLLNLIRKRKSARPAQEKESPSQPGPYKISRIKRLIAKLPKIPKIKIPAFRFSSTPTNRALLIIIIILAVYLVLDFLIMGTRRIEERTLMLEAERGLLEIEKGLKQAQPKEPLDYYIEPVESRELFTARAAVAGQKPTATFMQKVSKLKLQGIISGDNPQAIIEDTQTKQTHFLFPGERIDDEIELKQILPGRVILDYFGQEAELAL